MRISDWSSDVCSSDLAVRSRGRSRRVDKPGRRSGLPCRAPRHGGEAAGLAQPPPGPAPHRLVAHPRRSLRLARLYPLTFPSLEAPSLGPTQQRKEPLMVEEEQAQDLNIVVTGKS